MCVCLCVPAVLLAKILKLSPHKLPSKSHCVYILTFSKCLSSLKAKWLNVAFTCWQSLGELSPQAVTSPFPLFSPPHAQAIRDRANERERYKKRKRKSTNKRRKRCQRTLLRLRRKRGITKHSETDRDEANEETLRPKRGKTNRRIVRERENAVVNV